MASINENPKKIIFQSGAFHQKSYYISLFVRACSVMNDWKSRLCYLKKFSKLDKTQGGRFFISWVAQLALLHMENRFIDINSCFYMFQLSAQNEWDNPKWKE